MTRDEILSMPAGREMDALILKNVFEYTFPVDKCCPVCGWTYTEQGCQPGSCSMRPTPKPRADEPRPYSTDIAAAWEVVEKMKDKFLYVGILSDNYACVFDWGEPQRHVCAVAQTVPLAICKAALLAVMETE